MDKEEERAKGERGAGGAIGFEEKKGGKDDAEHKQAVEAAFGHVADDDGVEEPGVDEGKSGDGDRVEAAEHDPEKAERDAEGDGGVKAEGNVGGAEEREPEPAGEVEGEAAAIGALLPGGDHVAPGGVVEKHPAEHFVFPQDAVVTEDEAGKDREEEARGHPADVGAGERGRRGAGGRGHGWRPAGADGVAGRVGEERRRGDGGRDCGKGLALRTARDECMDARVRDRGWADVAEAEIALRRRM